MTVKTEKIENADIVSDASGRQYHIALAPGELAENIMMVGEAARATRAAQFLTDITVDQHNREYQTYTGKYKGTPVSIMSTGMGPGCSEIGLIEIFQITKKPTLIRVGTCGGLQPHFKLGDLIISSGAVRLEDTSTYFVHEGYPAVASHEVVLALIAAADKLKEPYHVGLTASASGFYGAQGRDIPGINVRNPDLPEQMAAMNVANFEMESSVIFNLAQMKGLRASSICLVLAHRPDGTFIEPEAKKIGEMKAIETALESFRILEKMDQERDARGLDYWVPSLSLDDE